MNVVRAIRTITLLEAFLLAILFSRREVTFYSLKRDFDLNAGGIAHAFRALTKDGLVTRSGQVGRSQAFQLTAAGDQALRSQWRKLLSNPVLDRESAVRIAWLAIVMDLGGTPALLRSLAQEIRRLSRADVSMLKATGRGLRGDDFYFVVKATEALDRIAARVEEVIEE
jgi:DNA-binding PadR family transcriptional regulator